MDSLADSYDEVPYDSKPFSITHPDGLAVAATLLGMHPARVDNCRVLELGCAAGGNLIPLAVALPGSRFVGIDLSPRQIADGQATIDALGQGNIELKTASILDVDDRYGQFDYILCHGVFSWVPAAVQDGIFDVCKRRLAAQGVAYVSYNTYPGWHLWSIARGMLMFHAAHFADSSSRLKAVRGLLDMLGRGVEDPPDLYGKILRREVEHLRDQADSYLFHEHLEDTNTPMFFWQFVERARARGLQYLEEAHLLDFTPPNVPREVIDTVRSWPVDAVHHEQYLDFLGGRSFRRTLLCHDDVPLRRPPSPAALAGMHATALSRCEVKDPDVCSPDSVDFRGADNNVYATTNPLVKALLVVAGANWPRYLPIAELCAEAGKRLQDGPAELRAALNPDLLARAVLHCYQAGLLDLHLHVPAHVLAAGARPLGSPLARLQAGKSGAVANLRHHAAHLNELDRAVLRLLDGSRDRTALARDLEDLLHKGILTVKLDDAPLTDPERIRQFVALALPASLDRLAHDALLL